MKSEFLDKLLKKAQENQQRIVFPETEAVRILQTASRLVELKAVIPVMIGKKETICALADENDVSTEGMIFVDHEDAELCEDIVKKYMNVCDLLSEKSIR